MLIRHMMSFLLSHFLPQWSFHLTAAAAAQQLIDSWHSYVCSYLLASILPPGGKVLTGGSETRFAAMCAILWSNVATSCSRSIMKSLHFASLYA